MTLDNKYFDLIHTQVSDNVKYEGYRNKLFPIVLFSEIDNTPLASLHFVSKGAKSIISHRTKTDEQASKENIDVQMIQGMINKNDQEFEFVITNLSDKANINFNIMKTTGKVSEVNPGGLNEVNELRPNETYAIQCD